MPFDDLDLEFEDENEPQIKVKDQKVPPVAPPVTRPQPSSSTAQLRVVGSSAIKDEGQSPTKKSVNLDAEVMLAMADYKTDFLVDLLSDVKVMEYQVGQLLARIHSKHPDIKQEALMIKKILADFTAKKRK